MLSGTNGSFSSPQYPLSYPNSVKCTWIIEVPAGHKVRLQFDSFRLETCTVPSVCTCDHVEVRDGRDESARSLGKFCGDNGPSILRSSGQQLWVEFDSDSLTRATGFSASFKAVRKYVMWRILSSYFKMTNTIRKAMRGGWRSTIS